MSLFLKIIKLIINIIVFLFILLVLPIGFIFNSMRLILDWAIDDWAISEKDFYQIFIDYFNLVKDRIEAIWDE